MIRVGWLPIVALCVSCFALGYVQCSAAAFADKMARSRALSVPIGEGMRQLRMQIRVTGVAAYKARMWLGIRLLRIACWIIGTSMEIVVDGKSDGDGA
jgi:hypothetical protein